MSDESPIPADAAPPVQGQAVVRARTGLHARPAVRLTKLAKRFEAAVRVRVGDGAWVNAKSPNAVMKLMARNGERLVFEAEGSDAQGAVNALVALVERDFGD